MLTTFVAQFGWFRYFLNINRFFFKPWLLEEKECWLIKLNAHLNVKFCV